MQTITVISNPYNSNIFWFSVTQTVGQASFMRLDYRKGETTNSMEWSPSWDGNRCSASEYIPCILCNWRFIRCSQQPTTCQFPKPDKSSPCPYIPRLYEPFLSALAKHSKKELLAVSCLSVHLQGTTQLSLAIISWSFIMGIFIKICLPNSSLVKTEQKWQTLYMKTYAYLC